MISDSAVRPARTLRVVLGLALMIVGLLWMAGGPSVAHAARLAEAECTPAPFTWQCHTAPVVYGGRRQTLFRLANGSGVDHIAHIAGGVDGEGTAMDIYSGCILDGSSINSIGYNNSASSHRYIIYQVTATTC